MKSPVYAVHCILLLNNDIFIPTRPHPHPVEIQMVTLQICPIDIVYQRCAMCIHAIFAKRANAAEQISLNNLYFICHGVFSGLIASGLRTIKKNSKASQFSLVFETYINE